MKDRWTLADSLNNILTASNCNGLKLLKPGVIATRIESKWQITNLLSDQINETQPYQKVGNAGEYAFVAKRGSRIFLFSLEDNRERKLPYKRIIFGNYYHAVLKNNKWIFINLDGREVSNAEYKSIEKIRRSDFWMVWISGKQKQILNPDLSVLKQVGI
ncbi:MAG: hypothetical protein R2850_05995 [Bacteroidia bacterium]